MNNEHKFQGYLVLESGEIIYTGAESKELAIDHIRHCLRHRDPRDRNPVMQGFYTGRDGQASEKEVFA